jgi:putative acetyltransferase
VHRSKVPLILITGWGAPRGSHLQNIKIKSGDLDDPRVIALLRQHLWGMHENSPPGSIFALDLAGLKAPEISFYTAWQDGELLGMGALKELDPSTGEIKSMRTDTRHLRKGVGATILEHLLTVARTRGYRRVSLETGTGPAFDPALALYRKRGFVKGEAFGNYKPTTFNQFYHVDLTVSGDEGGAV